LVRHFLGLTFFFSRPKELLRSNAHADNASFIPRPSFRLPTTDAVAVRPIYVSAITGSTAIDCVTLSAVHTGRFRRL